MKKSDELTEGKSSIAAVNDKDTDEDDNTSKQPSNDDKKPAAASPPPLTSSSKSTTTNHNNNIDNDGNESHDTFGFHINDEPRRGGVKSDVDHGLECGISAITTPHGIMEAMQNANRRALDYDRERGEAPPAVQTRRPSIESIPGAHRVYPSNREPSPERGGEGSTANDTEQVQPTMNAHSQHLEQSDQVVAEAYTVEEPPSPPVATVIDTCFGIERKRLLIIASVGLGVISIVLGCVFGIIVVPSRNNRQQEELTCGPLCGHGTTKLPNPNKKVLGATCESWDTNSTNLVIVSDDATSCADRYTAAAYGCACPGIEIPSDSCGMLCSSSDSSSDTSSLPDPDRVVKDIHNQELSCKDWQLKSHFETDSQECVNYNAVGALCGCTGNEMHPDSCDGICANGQDFLHSPGHSIWNTACESWDMYSRYLPSWYNNDKNETCEEYYSDVAYGCACPVLSDIEPECGTLCQQRRTCGPICEGGESEIPDPDLIVRRETCQAWELHSRLEVHEMVCPFYNMTGAQCGCKNKPVSDACGPLCGGESLPNPQKEVYGQTCESWDYMTTYLGPSYGKSEQNPIIKSCEEHFSAISYACGCSDIEPSSDEGGCGTLCGAIPLPDPTKIVNARTCQDLELLSLFETDSKQCTRYEIFGALCGCPSADVYEEDCFKLEHLQNKTYHFGAGGSIYSVSFGDGGYFAQLQSNGDLFMIGLFNGFDDDIATYGGGAPCGLHGPRSGSVAIVEDDFIESPEIKFVIEPSICVYQAELKVPKFCQDVDESKADDEDLIWQR